MDHSSGQEYRNTCQDMFADCMACIAREIFCRAAAKINLTVNVDTEVQCTATAQHWHANVDCRYTCEVSFQTCFGGADTQRCTRQKEMWDSCASREEYCRYGPGQDNKLALCMLVARECYWAALLLKQTITANVTCEMHDVTGWPICPSIADYNCQRALWRFTGLLNL